MWQRTPTHGHASHICHISTSGSHPGLQNRRSTHLPYQNRLSILPNAGFQWKGSTFTMSPKHTVKLYNFQYVLEPKINFYALYKLNGRKENSNSTNTKARTLSTTQKASTLHQQAKAGTMLSPRRKHFEDEHLLTPLCQTTRVPQYSNRSVQQEEQTLRTTQSSQREHETQSNWLHMPLHTKARAVPYSRTYKGTSHTILNDPKHVIVPYSTKASALLALRNIRRHTPSILEEHYERTNRPNRTICHQRHTSTSHRESLKALEDGGSYDRQAPVPLIGSLSRLRSKRLTPKLPVSAKGELTKFLRTTKQEGSSKGEFLKLSKTAHAS